MTDEATTHCQTLAPALSQKAREKSATICQVLHSLNVGGAEVLAARLARQLGGRYQFVFACLDEVGPLAEQLQRAGHVVECLQRRPGVDLKCARRLAALWREHGVGLVHAHQYTPFSYALLAGVARRRPPVLFTEHGRWFPDVPRRKRIVFNRLLLRKRDRVIGVGKSVRQALIDNEGIPAARVEVIYNGVEMSPQPPSPAQRVAMRTELGLSPADFLLIQVARLDALKDHATAVRTLSRVAGRLSQARLILVGDGPEHAAIEAAFRERHLTDRVRFLGLRSDVPELLAAADAFLLTSVSEGIPLTIIEAMAAGLPVVSTRVGGVPEIVVPEETGLLCTAGDDELLAAAVLRLAGDALLRESMGAAGRQRALDMFSESENHRAYQRLYDEMLSVP